MRIHENINAVEVFSETRTKRPDWLKVRAPGGESYAEIRTLMRNKTLHTVCEEAHCPNIGECWMHGTATFLILGDVCTRSCGFCAVKTGKPPILDTEEPLRVAESVMNMKLHHAVITSVNRDELEDGGSSIWAETINEVRRLNPNTTIEVLIPDFKGDMIAVQRVIDASPDIFNHNVETIPRLYKTVRPQAKFERSLDVLRYAKYHGMRTKSGFMVGLGEEKEEIFEVLRFLKEANIDIVTIGQYLRPSKDHLPVARYVHPDEFSEYKQYGLGLGIEHIESAPLVRSSYHAERAVLDSRR
ncbi:MAG: lipoyl synthase [Candidatus Kapabacteria bacterium]|nr:lipoyl synthase [Candidatus Kapabacteria bacterium]